jgi:Protein of unknown function (DUF664)
MTREQIVEAYRRAWEDSDATINALAIDAAGYVPWWPRPDIKLFNALVHVLNGTNRHAGHADILREQLDGSAGFAQWAVDDRAAAHWEARRARIESAAAAAAARFAGAEPTGCQRT